MSKIWNSGRKLIHYINSVNLSAVLTWVGNALIKSVVSSIPEKNMFSQIPLTGRGGRGTTTLSSALSRYSGLGGSGGASQSISETNC